jgi:hypothetical protein
MGTFIAVLVLQILSFVAQNERDKITTYVIVHSAIFKRTISRHINTTTTLKVTTNNYLVSLYKNTLPPELTDLAT